MLPLHSQDTAAIYINIEQALPSIIKFGNVFNKQTGRAREMIKKLKLLISRLINLKIYPCYSSNKHTNI